MPIMKLASPLLPVLQIKQSQPCQGGADKQQKIFSRGQILDGRVIGRENNQLTLDINGRQFIADGKTSLQTGERVGLQVTGTTPQVTMRVLGDSLMHNISSSLHLLATGSSPGYALASLASRVPTEGLSKATIQTLAFFSSFLPGGEESSGKQQTGSFGKSDAAQHKAVPDAAALKYLFNRSGLNLEQLLAAGKKEDAAHTMKSALLDIIPLGHDPKTVQQAQQLLSTVELFQMLQIRFAIESIFFQPLTLPFINEGFLLVEPDHRKSGSETDEKIKKYCLHLNLDGLGNLRIELEQQENGFHIRFFGEDQPRTKFLADNRTELHEKFKDIELASVQFLTGAENPTRTLMKILTGESSGIINTRV